MKLALSIAAAALLAVAVLFGRGGVSFSFAYYLGGKVVKSQVQFGLYEVEPQPSLDLLIPKKA